ncbi:MAG: hypothetical protein WB795_19685 [Candidatus Acidiferrales bacterium]
MSKVAVIAYDLGFIDSNHRITKSISTPFLEKMQEKTISDLESMVIMAMLTGNFGLIPLGAITQQQQDHGQGDEGDCAATANKSGN